MHMVRKSNRKADHEEFAAPSFQHTSLLFRGNSLKIFVSSPFGMSQQFFKLLVSVCGFIAFLDSVFWLPTDRWRLISSVSPYFTSPCFTTVYTFSIRYLCSVKQLVKPPVAIPTTTANISWSPNNDQDIDNTGFPYTSSTPTHLLISYFLYYWGG